MPQLYGEIASTSPSHACGAYIYSVLPIAGDKLAILTSGDEILFLDKIDLKSISRHHDNVPRPVSCIVRSENSEYMVVCAGGEGMVATFDVRCNKRVSHFTIG